MLAEIYRGTITSGTTRGSAALNQGLHAAAAARSCRVHRTDSSGDTFLFTSYLSTQDAGWDSQIGYGTTAAWPHVAAARAPRGRAAPPC